MDNQIAQANISAAATVELAGTHEETLLRTRFVWLVSLLTLLIASAALANPVPGPEVYIGASYWFIKTIPLDYAVDLIALSMAMLATAQLPASSWKLLPLYNIPVLVAGFTADYLGAVLANVGSTVPGAVVTSKDPVIGQMLDAGTSTYALTSGQAAAFLFWTTLLVFGFNIAIIAGLLRINQADSYSRLPIAAAIMAVITTPYLSVNKAVAWTRVVPLLMALVGVMAFYGVRWFLATRRVK